MKIRFEDLKDSPIGTIHKESPDDLFIVSSSFEERAVAVAESIVATYRCRHGLIYVDKEFLEGPQAEKTRANTARLQEVVGRFSEIVQVVEGSWLQPKVQLIKLRAVISALQELGPEPTAVTLDVTTFTRETLMLTTALVRTHLSNATVRVMYVSPKTMGPWLSRGFRAIRNVLGFAGLQQPSKPTLLVVLSGFEPERTIKIIEEHEPREVLLGIGDPPTLPAFLQRNESDQKLVLARQDLRTFKFPANDLSACRERLEAVISPYLNDFNVIVAPMSTKLSTLAALLIAERHKEIQVTYCLPGEYNVNDYSSGKDSLFMCLLPDAKEKYS